jgi:hypothetical protein
MGWMGVSVHRLFMTYTRTNSLFWGMVDTAESSCLPIDTGRFLVALINLICFTVLVLTFIVTYWLKCVALFVIR